MIPSFHGVVDFLLPRRKLFFRAAVDDVHFLGSEPLGAARCVHGDISAADNGHFFALFDRRCRFGQVGLHQVDPRQILVGGVDTLEVFARNFHKHRQSCARSDEHRFVAVLVEEFVDGDRPADDHVRPHFDSEFDERIDFFLHDILGKTEFGNAVYEHATGRMEGFEHGDRVTHARQTSRAGEAGRAGSDDRNFAAVFRTADGFVLRVLAMCQVSVKSARGARCRPVSFDAADAYRFRTAISAGILCRTRPEASCPDR